MEFNSCSYGILRVNSLSVKYDSVNALKDISFSIAAGDFVALVGANGAGKSSLLNALYGLISPSNGDITYNSSYINTKQPATSIGFAAQKLIVDWYLNVSENVYLGAILGGIKKDNIKPAVIKALERVSLIEKANSSVETLSGGQQQRVQIARAIVHEPTLYILDEPTTGLDPTLAESFFLYLQEENAKGKTIIVSSHDLFLLEKYCNKVLFLENGTLLYYGDLKKFLKLNANKRLYLVKTDTVFKNDILFNDSRVTALYNPNDEKSFFIELTNGASLENALQDLISSYNIIELKLFDKNDLRSIFINEKGRDKNAS